MSVDTLQISRRLQKAKLSKPISDEIASIIREREESHLVNRRDLREMELRIKLSMWTVGAAVVAALKILERFS